MRGFVHLLNVDQVPSVVQCCRPPAVGRSRPSSFFLLVTSHLDITLRRSPAYEGAMSAARRGVGCTTPAPCPRKLSSFDYLWRSRCPRPAQSRAPYLRRVTAAGERLGLTTAPAEIARPHLACRPGQASSGAGLTPADPVQSGDAEPRVPRPSRPPGHRGGSPL